MYTLFSFSLTFFPGNLCILRNSSPGNASKSSQKRPRLITPREIVKEGLE